jgi:hypothetical protein
MEIKLKKIIFPLALSIVSSIAAAAGPLDGIYSCGVRLLGATYASYITINGHTDGGSVFAVAAVSPSQTFYGYGIGSATQTTFTGTTMFGTPFSMFYNPTNGVFSGNIGVLWNGSITIDSAH